MCTRTEESNGGSDRVVAVKKELCKEERDVPTVLLPWLYMYRLVPKIYLPFTSLDVSFTLASTIFLIGVNLIIRRALLALGWPEGDPVTLEVACSMTSVFHSIHLVPGLAACLLTQQYVPSAKMEGAPRWWQESVTALLQFCTGYMFYDTIIFFIIGKWVPGVGPVFSTSDWMFLGHHFATVFYMTSCRLIGAGHISAMILMFTGEFTNPFQNSFLASRHAIKLECCSGPLVHMLHPYIEYSYALFYSIFRIVIGPAFSLHLTYDLLLTKQGRKNIHIALQMIWLPMVWGVIFGSIPWIEECVEMLKDGLEVKYGPDSEF